MGREINPGGESRKEKVPRARRMNGKKHPQASGFRTPEVINGKSLETRRPPYDKESAGRFSLREDGEDLMRRAAGHEHDAANDGTEASPAVRAVYQRRAASEREHGEALRRQRAGIADVEIITTGELVAKPCPYNIVKGCVYGGALVTLVAPIPIFVAGMVAESELLETVSSNPLLGLPFGIPAVCSILAASQIRGKLSNAWRDRWDQWLPVVGLAALGLWGFAFGSTFMGDLSGTSGYGQPVETDGTLFYLSALLVEVTAALGLEAGVEKSFTAGRKRVLVAVEGADELRQMVDEAFERELAATRASSERDVFAERMEHNREAYVEESVGVYLEAAEQRRANIAQAHSKVPELPDSEAPKRKRRNGHASVVAAAALGTMLVAGSGEGQAADWTFVLPERLERAEPVLGQASWRIFQAESGPGDRLVYLNGTNNRTIAWIDIPPDKKYARWKRRAKDFAGQNQRVGAFLKNMGAGGGAPQGRLRLIETLHRYGDDRVDRGRPVHLLAVGSPLQRTAEQAFSMVREDGALAIPSDSMIAGAVATSPYGTKGRGDNLANVYVHFCVTEVSDRPLFERDALHRFWALWLKAQGGTLATWTVDLAACLNRFQARIQEPITVQPLDPGVPVAMMVTATNGGATEIRDENGNVAPDSYSTFTVRNHPKRSDIQVYTGIEYLPDGFPSKFLEAWCYFHALDQDATQIRVNVGEKKPGQSVNWSIPNKKALRAISMSVSDFTAARTACRFPRS